MVSRITGSSWFLIAGYEISLKLNKQQYQTSWQSAAGSWQNFGALCIVP